ncbi:MAG: PAS domain-containing protein [Treponema sp.]|nr:PAS domain-containing protein [Treponema sp.]
MKKAKGENFHQSNLIVVGVGASAGGLEALQDFFKNMPVNTGMAFVVIQHLSPDYKSLMDELLARETSIPIQIAEDGMDVLPDHIYLIPPRKNLSIFHDKLYLENQEPKKRLNLPVDIFFRSLALDKGKNAIGIILSGTGSDGTLGTRAIKEAGGMIMVQDEESAKFDGMPRSCIATGLVDYILPPAKMPEALVNYIKHPLVREKKSLEGDLQDNLDTLTKIILILRNFGGIDFSFYKDTTILRRLERRLSINRHQTLEEYLEFLKDSDKEKETLQRELLIGVTRFFRDVEAFEALRTKVFPSWKGKTSIRIWSAGCSTGEEVYSLAILLIEYMEQQGLSMDIKIFATDVDRNSIEYAGKGFYPDSVVADLEPTLLTKYFIRKDNGYQINDSIRKMIVFATHNLLKDSPFSRIDLIVCRNLFIYIRPEIQTKLLSMFYYSLNTDGYLFLGTSETLGEMSEAFEYIDTKWKIFRIKSNYKEQYGKIVPLLKSGLIEQPNTFPTKVIAEEGIRIEKILDRTLSLFLPPSVIVDQSFNIIHTINDINPYIKIKPGRFSQNLFDNIPADMSLFVSSLLRKLKHENESIATETIFDLKGFEEKQILLTGKKIETERTNYYIISFSENAKTIPAPKAVLPEAHSQKEYRDRVSELEKELQFTKESLQATVEELETSNEELQSSNEELIASNEELQSTNEELQSVNEELYTVNTEYQVKIEELTRLNNDINNLLKNTEIGAIYLDRNLCIRKITPVISKLTPLMASDLGRPIYHLSLGPGLENLFQDIQDVVDSLQPRDREIELEGSGTYLVRIRPYRTDYNAVDGVLIIFVDISDLKKQHKLTQTLSQRLENALAIGNMAWWEWDVETGIVDYDERKATMIGYTAKEFPKEIYAICSYIHPDDYNATMESMRNYLEGKSKEWNSLYRIRRKDGTYAWYYDRGLIIERTSDGKPKRLMGTVIDFSRIRDLETELVKRQELLETILDKIPVAATMVSSDGHITYANEKAEELFGITKEEIERRTYNDSQWKITDLQGNPLHAEDLPFALVKKNLKSLRDFQHYIEIPGKIKKLLHIDGTPIIAANGSFEGAIFVIRTDAEE